MDHVLIHPLVQHPQRLALHQFGSYDSTFDATVEPDGSWQVEGGSYITHGRREGRLSHTEHADLITLAARVDLEALHPIPDPNGFISELVVGEHATRWWGPPPTEAIRALASALARLRA